MSLIKRFVQILVLVLIVFIFINPFSKKTGLALVVINNKSITVEIANTLTKQERGLGLRDHLEENHGMLFPLSNSNPRPAFWMKDMLINIDIIWIGEGKIVKIDKNVPAPRTASDRLPLYQSPTAVNYVLEVNAGFSEANNFQVGDNVNITNL